MATQFDLVIRNGRIVTCDAVFEADIGISAGRITAIGQTLDNGAKEIDAHGKLVTPGGVDSHCHIEQMSGSGLMNADTFESASCSAAFGGTTSVVSFAAQHPGHALRDVVRDYSALARRGAMIDYSFHMIVSDVSGDNLSADLPALIAAGHRSIKIFTTYDKVRLDDAQILAVLGAARQGGAIVCIHAENHALIQLATQRNLAQGLTAPEHHASSHPRLAEIEALERMTHFSAFVDQPIMLFHISTKEGVEIVRRARHKGLRVFAETCPHYLFMTEDILRQPGTDGAKFICSPPQRRAEDQEALWMGLRLGDLQQVTSDHAPYRHDHTGKFSHGPDAPFNRIANGMPGLETRLPLLFDAMVSQGRLSPQEFVALTATGPAEIFGLERKGRIAVGADADLVVWDPDKTVTYDDDDLHDNVNYNPFAGRTIKGWPATVILRGETLVADGAFHGTPGQGQFIPMALSDAMRPAG